VIHFAGILPSKNVASVRYGTLAEFAGWAGVGAIEVVEYAKCLDTDVVVARARHLWGEAVTT